MQKRCSVLRRTVSPLYHSFLLTRRELLHGQCQFPINAFTLFNVVVSKTEQFFLLERFLANPFPFASQDLI